MNFPKTPQENLIHARTLVMGKFIHALSRTTVRDGCMRHSIVIPTSRSIFNLGLVSSYCDINFYLN